MEFLELKALPLGRPISKVQVDAQSGLTTHGTGLPTGR